MIRSLAIVAALCLCGTSAKAELTMQECRAKYKAEQAAESSVRIGLTSKKRNVGIATSAKIQKNRTLSSAYQSVCGGPSSSLSLAVNIAIRTSASAPPQNSAYIYSSLILLLFGKRPQKRPQPSSLCDCVRCPVAILEVSVSNTARRAGLNPPCKRQRFWPRMAGRWHGVPARVLAPHLGASRRLLINSCRKILVHGVVRKSWCPPAEAC